MEALSAQSDSPPSFGSEFKPFHLIKTLLLSHPLWKFMSTILSNGASYPLRKINQNERSQDTSFFLSCGNHKSVNQNEAVVLKLLQDDIEKGFPLMLPISVAHKLQNTFISPLGNNKIQETKKVKSCKRIILPTTNPSLAYQVTLLIFVSSMRIYHPVNTDVVFITSSIILLILETAILPHRSIYQNTILILHSIDAACLPKLPSKAAASSMVISL